MGLQPTNWTVVIAGRWNRAILTPKGIAKRVYRLGDTKVLVAVPLDGVSPYMVSHPAQEIVASTDESRLLIRVKRADYETLGHAMVAGVNALESLPETPVSAAGFNIDFRSEQTTTKMASLLVSEPEKALVDAGFRPVARTVGRSLQCDPGKLNVTMTGEEDRFRLSLNFHRGSEVAPELIEWLRMPVAQVEAVVNKVMGALGLEVAEAEDDADTE